jgi:hypothetical protein
MTTEQQMKAAIKELEETAIVMSHIQARQTEAIRNHAEWLEAHEKAMTQSRERGDRTDARIEKLVSAIGGLIAKQK